MHLVRWFMLLVLRVFGGHRKTQIISTDFYSRVYYMIMSITTRSFTEYVSQQSLFKGCGRKVEQLRQNGARQGANDKASEGRGFESSCPTGNVAHLVHTFLFSGSTLATPSRRPIFLCVRLNYGPEKRCWKGGGGAPPRPPKNDRWAPSQRRFNVENIQLGESSLRHRCA